MYLCAFDGLVYSRLVLRFISPRKSSSSSTSEYNVKISMVYLRSDEAGCYHNNLLPASLKDLGQRVGIKVMRYDFSEPQHGKDVCDRILCPMKLAIQKYCNEGHDIFTASDMRRALLERPVSETSTSVNRIDYILP